jgi:hypothetical protein
MTSKGNNILVEAQNFAKPISEINEIMKPNYGTVRIRDALDEAVRIIRKEQKRNIFVVLITDAKDKRRDEALKGANIMNKMRESITH